MRSGRESVKRSLSTVSFVLSGYSCRDRLCGGMDYISAPWTAVLSLSLGQTPSNGMLNFPEAALLISLWNFYPLDDFFFSFLLHFVTLLLHRQLCVIGELLNILYTDSHKSVTVVKCLFVPSNSCVVSLLIFKFYLSVLLYITSNLEVNWDRVLLGSSHLSSELMTLLGCTLLILMSSCEFKAFWLHFRRRSAVCGFHLKMGKESTSL